MKQPQQQQNKQPDAATLSNPATVAKIANRFAAHFPITGLRFTDDVRAPDKPWNDGTISQTLATVAVELGETKAFIPSARIVAKTLPNGGGRVLDLQMPSSGGKFRFPMLEVKADENCRLDFEAWKRDAIGAYITYRKAAVSAGAATITGSTPKIGMSVDDDMLKVLGLYKEPEPKTPEPAEPVTT